MRTEINRALAKALAYADCGKREEAARWAAELIRLLELAGVPTCEGYQTHVERKADAVSVSGLDRMQRGGAR